jgi:hypothetical protein
MSKNKTQTISISTFVKKLLYNSCYLMTYLHYIYIYIYIYMCVCVCVCVHLFIQINNKSHTLCNFEDVTVIYKSYK